VRLNTEAHATQPTIEFTAPEESTITSLAVIETTSAALVYAPGALTALVDRLKQEVRAQLATLDVSIPSQRARIISLSARVASAKVKLDKLGDSLIEEHRAVVTAVNADRKVMRDDMDAFKVEVRKPVTDLENAEKERVAAHESALLDISRQAEGIPVWSIEECEAKLARIGFLYNSRQWEEFLKRAQDARNTAGLIVQRAATEARRREEERAELERLRAEAAERAIKEREEAAAKAAQEAAERRAAEQARIAREAAERERKRVENEREEAEARAKQAEAERVAAAEKAERDRIAEAERTKQRLAEIESCAAAERTRLEQERIAEAEATRRREYEAQQKAERDQVAAVEAERQRVAAQKKADAEEAEKRAKNRAHRLKIGNEALGAIVALDIPMDRAQDLLIAIAKGAVPHVTISY
jgi:hypothetical protein